MTRVVRGNVRLSLSLPVDACIYTIASVSLYFVNRTSSVCDKCLVVIVIWLLSVSEINQMDCEKIASNDISKTAKRVKSLLKAYVHCTLYLKKLCLLNLNWKKLESILIILAHYIC